MRRVLPWASVFLLVFLLVITLAAGEGQLSYAITIRSEGDTYSLDQLKIVEASPMPHASGNPYRVQVVSFEGGVLFETSLEFDDLAAYAIPNDAIPTLRGQSRRAAIDLLLPYFPDGEKVRMLHGGGILLEIDVSMFAIQLEAISPEEDEASGRRFPFAPLVISVIVVLLATIFLLGSMVKEPS